jgi:hypothetical protein
MKSNNSKSTLKSCFQAIAEKLKNLLFLSFEQRLNRIAQPSNINNIDSMSFAPHMPDVDIWDDMDKTFESARHLVAEEGENAIAIVTPGHRMVLPVAVPLIPPNERQKPQYASLGDFVSLTVPQYITVIAMTDLSVGLKDVYQPGDPPFSGSRAIPFFGYLMAIASLVHRYTTLSFSKGTLVLLRWVVRMLKYLSLMVVWCHCFSQIGSRLHAQLCSRNLRF